MLTLVDDLRELKRGTHALSLHSSTEEGARHAAEFLAGTPKGQSAAYWVFDPRRAQYYRRWLSREAPEQVGSVAVLNHSQAVPEGGRLRPAPEVQEFMGRHPDGVTAAGETISHFWQPRNIPDHLEYEAWFQEQPRARSRFLCPYDLREIPVADAPEILRELGAHHTHLTLSRSAEPAVRLLQLFAFPTPEEMPAALEETLDWAISEGYVEVETDPPDLVLTTAGDRIVRSWAEPDR